MRLTTHLINLPTSPVRRKVALARTSTHGLDVKLFEAIDGRALSLSSALAGSLTPGEVGCYLTHRSLLAEVADSRKTDVHLILEDDVVFYPEFRAGLERVLWEMASREECSVQVGWLPTSDQVGAASVLRNRLAASRITRSVVHGLHPRTPKSAPWVVDRPLGWGTHCYVVSSESASQLIRFLPDIPLAPIDYYFRAFAVLRPGGFLRTRFPLAGQDWQFESEVDAGRFAYNVHQLDARGRLRRHK